MNVEEAKEVLRKAGYYVDCLWSIEDVDFAIRNSEEPEKYEDLTDAEKYKILDTVFSDDWLMEKIGEEIYSELACSIN
jgi:hypothetical protein